MSDAKMLSALEELRLFLEHAQDAASRLKQEIPSNDFPAAYHISVKIRELRKSVDILRGQVSPEAEDYTLQIFEADRLSSSDSMIGH